MNREIPLSVQIGEVKRELLMREDVYGRGVRTGTIKPTGANKQLRIMRAVLETLETLREQELRQYGETVTD
jgi:hypothetical protein